jgi:hypothetical protein
MSRHSRLSPNLLATCLVGQPPWHPSLQSLSPASCTTDHDDNMKLGGGLRMPSVVAGPLAYRQTAKGGVVAGLISVVVYVAALVEYVRYKLRRSGSSSLGLLLFVV